MDTPAPPSDDSAASVAVDVRESIPLVDKDASSDVDSTGEPWAAGHANHWKACFKGDAGGLCTVFSLSERIDSEDIEVP